MNQHDILKTAVADVSKGQTDISCKGELQTLIKLSMRHQYMTIVYVLLVLLVTMLATTITSLCDLTI